MYSHLSLYSLIVQLFSNGSRFSSRCLFEFWSRYLRPCRYTPGVVGGFGTVVGVSEQCAETASTSNPSPLSGYFEKSVVSVIVTYLNQFQPLSLMSTSVVPPAFLLVAVPTSLQFLPSWLIWIFAVSVAYFSLSNVYSCIVRSFPSLRCTSSLILIVIKPAFPSE